MLRRLGGVKLGRLVVILPLIIALCIPFASTRRSDAATFKIKTGYYIGNGATQTLSGFGFAPDLIISKAATAVVGYLKTSSMSGSTVVPMNAAAAGNGMTITSDGFSIDATPVNTLATQYFYVAISGSDCTASGSFCVGSYTGNGSSSRLISTGFQPDMAAVKVATSVFAANFRTTSMPANTSEYFNSTAANTTGFLIASMSSTGFNIGSSNNTNGSTYYYFAFKSGGGVFNEGSYTGNGLDNRDLSVTAYKPNFVLVKNSGSLTANSRRSVFSIKQNYGDQSNYTVDGVASAADMIQKLNTDGFQVGSTANVNESAISHYWIAIGGTASSGTASGTYKMAVGSYTGTGSATSVTGLGFRPDLVIIKSNTTNVSVLRTSQMMGDATTATSGATSDFALAITSLDADGFSIGTDGTVNTSAVGYHWQAFGSAFSPILSSGASDFAVGTYTGNGVDDRNIDDLPFTPDLVYIKRSGATGGVFRTSQESGDNSLQFTSAAEAANLIQGFGTNSFQIGNSTTVNSANGTFRWVAFKAGTNMKVGSYAGNAVLDREITDPAMSSNLIWIKQTSVQPAVSRPSTLSGDNTQQFGTTANTAGLIKSITSSGFTTGNSSIVNGNGSNYKYVAWKIPPTGSLGVNVVDSGGSTVASPSFSMTSSGYQFDCSTNTGSLGSSSQRIRVTNTTASPGWTLTVAATSGASTLWQNGGSTQNYDFNDTTSSGCSDGADADSKAGRMTIDASAGTLTPQSGCNNDNVTKGSSANFNQDVTDSITLLNASSSAQTSCYWELIGVGLSQVIPAQQTPDSYTINMTVTLTAS